MDYRTYQQIRTYCTHDLRDYLDLPGYDAVRLVYAKLNGRIGLVQREIELALSLHQCDGLTPRERAAAELLAAVSNHWANAWLREPKPPDGREQLPQLTKDEADAQKKQTLDAVKRYAAFLPEPERAVLIADCEAAPTAAPAAKVEASAGITPGDDWREEARAIADECFDHDTNAKPPVRDSLATKNSVGHITGGYSFRVMGLMQERGIKGARGIITNPATIMREALQGDLWWAKKSK